MTDSLLAAAGMLSPSLAGKALALDYLEEEQRRQMTIKAANISLYHEHQGKPYVINLIDTPGHIDFTGRVTRSLRAIDGAVVVVDAVEEVMVQTETVTRQALSERVRPVLYINKVDRLIKELRLSQQEIHRKLARIIEKFNSLIEMYAELEHKKWKVSAAEGTVAFGSAKDRWGITLKIAQERGVKFSDIIEAYKRGTIDELVKTIPLHEAILDMVVDHIPPPHIAQEYRIPKIWRGDPKTEVGQAMIECDEDGPVVLCVNSVNVDPQAGIVATGRLFSGTIEEGCEVHLINAATSSRIQQVCLYTGPYREVAKSMPAGNIPALLGLDKARVGETITTVENLTPFEAIRYISEPVVVMAIEPKRSADLLKLVTVLNNLSVEDPTLVTTVREETGEYLIAGMGTLHLEIATTWIRKAGIDIITSKPIVIYRESIRKPSPSFEVKSPNKLNRFTFRVEPLEPEIVEMIVRGEIRDGMPRKALAKLLREHGWDSDSARGAIAIEEHGNILTNVSKGVQRLDQVMGSIQIGFVDAVREGPLAREQVRGVKVLLEDAFIHVDPVHTGPAQIVPATRRAIHASILAAEPMLLEPVYKIVATLPSTMIGTTTRIVAHKRGRISSIDQREYLACVTGELPAAESFDLADVIRSATGGRAFWQTTFDHWEPVPASMKLEIIKGIRKRKGLALEIPKPEDMLT